MVVPPTAAHYLESDPAIFTFSVYTCVDLLLLFLSCLAVVLHFFVLLCIHVVVERAGYLCLVLLDRNKSTKWTRNVRKPWGPYLVRQKYLIKTRSFKPLLCFSRVFSLILASIFIFEISFFSFLLCLFIFQVLYTFLPLYTCILCIALVSIQWPTLRLRPQRNSWRVCCLKWDQWSL